MKSTAEPTSSFPSSSPTRAFSSIFGSVSAILNCFQGTVVVEVCFAIRNKYVVEGKKKEREEPVYGKISVILISD
jgi:hypothetical protein